MAATKNKNPQQPLTEQAIEECLRYGGVLYEVRLTGITPLLMHADNLYYTEKVNIWRKDPQNKKTSVAGDDRFPAWTWGGYCYTDSCYDSLIIPSDNIMTLLREAGAKVPTGKSRATYKFVTQYGVSVPDYFFYFTVGGKQIKKDWINALVDDNNFENHIKEVEEHGFELFLKRAKIGTGLRASKHVRVRPMFRDWAAFGKILVPDEKETGLKEDVLMQILKIGGTQVGLGDWRPSSPSSGSYGKFKVELERVS